MIELAVEQAFLLNKIDWNFIKATSDELHSIHPYPAKFIPEIPSKLIEILGIPEGTVLLDPFCGSGVTLTEGLKKRIPTIGVDLNPIACLLSRVKTQELPDNFSEVVSVILNNCLSFTGQIAIPIIPNLDHWFKPDIQRALAILLTEIDWYTDSKMNDALRFCFSSIIVKVSNQESDTRYAAIDKGEKRDYVFTAFKASAEKLRKAKANAGITNDEIRVLNKNSLRLTPEDMGGPIGLVITSPPYPNAYEYWLYHKYRMWWLGYDPIEVKEQEIGARAHYFKKNHQTAHDFIGQMQELFKFFEENCHAQAYIAFIIGRSKIHGQIIDNEKIIAEVGNQHGFSHITTIARTIKSSRKSFNLAHARIKDEYIVILQNNR